MKKAGTLKNKKGLFALWNPETETIEYDESWFKGRSVQEIEMAKTKMDVVFKMFGRWQAIIDTLTDFSQSDDPRLRTYLMSIIKNMVEYQENTKMVFKNCYGMEVGYLRLDEVK